MGKDKKEQEISNILFETNKEVRLLIQPTFRREQSCTECDEHSAMKLDFDDFTKPWRKETTLTSELTFNTTVGVIKYSKEEEH